MSKEEKQQNYEEFMEVLQEEEKREENNERRYYRHNVSLEYLQKYDVPIEFEYAKYTSGIEKEVNELLDFTDFISDSNLYKALKKLNESDFKVIELRYRYGFSLNEIAVKLQIKNDAVRQKHIRALAKLKSILEKNL